MDTKILAHRGASAYAPENTMPAFELAEKLGADGLELDVQFTKDREIVVIHDSTVDRTSNSVGRVADLTLGELMKLDFSNGVAGFEGVKLPLLEEVLGFVAKEGLFLNIEIKEFSSDEGRFAINDRLMELEKRYGLSGRIAYSSFHHGALRDLKNRFGAPTGLLYDCYLVDVWDYAAMAGADAIHPHYRLLDRETAAGCEGAGLAIRPWTVDGEDDLKAMFRLGVDSVITNRPDVALSVREKI